MTFLDTDNVEFVAFRRKMVNMKQRLVNFTNNKIKSNVGNDEDKIKYHNIGIPIYEAIAIILKCQPQLEKEKQETFSSALFF